MTNARLLSELAASVAVGFFLALLFHLGQTLPELPSKAHAVEIALAQGFLAGFTLEPHEAPAEAAQVSERVVKGPAQAQALYKDALISYVRGDRARALDLLDQARQADPDNALIRNARARIEREGG